MCGSGCVCQLTSTEGPRFGRCGAAMVGNGRYSRVVYLLAQSCSRPSMAIPGRRRVLVVVVVVVSVLDWQWCFSCQKQAASAHRTQNTAQARMKQRNAKLLSTLDFPGDVINPQCYSSILLYCTVQALYSHLPRLISSCICMSARLECCMHGKPSEHSEFSDLQCMCTVATCSIAVMRNLPRARLDQPQYYSSIPNMCFCPENK